MSNTHRCPATGCTVKVPSSRIMCRQHWFQVPKPIRDLVWQSHRSGNRDAHLRNIKAAVKSVREVPSEAI